MATKKKKTETPAPAAEKKATAKRSTKKAAKKTKAAKAPKAAKAAKPAKAKKAKAVKAKAPKAAKAAKPVKAKKAKAAKAKAPKAAKPRAKKAKAEAAPAEVVESGEPEHTKGAKDDGPRALPAPEVGSQAPAFSLRADDGSEVSLESLAGKNVVLYFYPKDATPGCTIEACSFRDAYAEIESKGAVVLGVSRDSVASHARFRDKQSLPFRLLSDPTGETIAAYGSWGQKTFMGRTGMGILRTTILIDGAGTVIKVYPKVSPKDHVTQVLKDLEALA